MWHGDTLDKVPKSAQLVLQSRTGRQRLSDLQLPCPSRLSLRTSWLRGGAGLSCHQGMSVKDFEPPTLGEPSTILKCAKGSWSIALAHRAG
jgi:hypothetical protein